MEITLLDWGIIAFVFIVSLGIGLYASRTAKSSSAEFFLSGRKMPWWLLGVSMVATTFSADTPNLVTQFVREGGVAANWQWWAFLVTGMLTVFIYAKLWRRAEVTTDLEFYELRYGGKPAMWLRAFRSLYLGVFFNVVIMSSVLVASIKIFNILLGWNEITTVLAVSGVTVIYSGLGGLKGVVLSDFFQFFIAMIGSVGAAIYIVNIPEIGSLEMLINHPNVASKLHFLPDFTHDNPKVWITIFLMPIAVQWWATWYPGAEPGGGGYIAQRMLSAKDEKNAIGATLLFNIAHYGLRPWPWILIALASIIVFPEVSDIQAAFPQISENKLSDDIAYPAMLTYLPEGLIGVVLASLIAAVMSTISTHLNWGSSYVVHDFYARFVKPSASEFEQVNVGRLSTVLLMVLSGILALTIEDAGQAFYILLQIGAGTGAIYLLRWFWWRINAWTEISGMISSLIVAVFLEIINKKFLFFPYLEEQQYWKLIIGVAITTVCWIVVTLLTPPEKDETLRSFYNRIHPASIGWKSFLRKNSDIKEEIGQLPLELSMMLVGTIMVYASLFAIGSLLYGQYITSSICVIVGTACAFMIYKNWRKIKFG